MTACATYTPNLWTNIAAHQQTGDAPNPQRLPKSAYHTYIRSNEWRQRANAAKRRAGYRCQICNKPGSQTQLDAHHRTYERLGYERPDDITVLCHTCHDLYEQAQKLPKPPALHAQTITAPTAPPMLKRGVGWWTVGIAAVVITVVGLFFTLAANQNPVLATPLPPTTTADAARGVQPTASAAMVPTPTSACAQATVNTAATIHRGPSDSYTILHIVAANTAVCPVAYNHDAGPVWYKLRAGGWVLHDMVNNAPGGLPYEPASLPTRPRPTATPVTVQVPPTPTSVPPTPVPTAYPTAAPTTAAPISAPVQQATACNIKGNISYRTGERIYHVPGGQYYAQTKISSGRGERWFCTEREAVAAGWRRSYR